MTKLVVMKQVMTELVMTKLVMTKQFNDPNQQNHLADLKWKSAGGTDPDRTIDQYAVKHTALFGALKKLAFLAIEEKVWLKIH